PCNRPGCNLLVGRGPSAAPHSEHHHGTQHMRSAIQKSHPFRRSMILLATGFAAACTSVDAAESDRPTSPEVQPAADAARDAAMDAPLARVRDATVKYQLVVVPIGGGGVRDPVNACETAEMIGRPASEGAMGIH